MKWSSWKEKNEEEVKGSAEYKGREVSGVIWHGEVKWKES